MIADPEGRRIDLRRGGIPVAGGHSIDSVEPIYGLVVLGVVHPKRVKRNASARAGDVLILGKPFGRGRVVGGAQGSTRCRRLRRDDRRDDQAESARRRISRHSTPFTR